MNIVTGLFIQINKKNYFYFNHNIVNIKIKCKIYKYFEILHLMNKIKLIVWYFYKNTISNIFFSNNKNTKNTNKKFRKKKFYLDTLSFPSPKNIYKNSIFLGDVILYYKEDTGSDVLTYLFFSNIFHSILHLLSHEHGYYMQNIEKKYSFFFTP